MAYGAWIPREAGRLITISELAELKDFKIKYRTDNTKDEKFFTSTYSISFQADAKVPVIDLANGSLDLTLKSQKSSGYKVVTEEGIISLIGLSKIQSSFLWTGEDLKPLATKFKTLMLRLGLPQI